MTDKKIEFRKKRELGEIISDSFKFIKQEYQPLSKIVVKYALPFLILYGILQAYVQSKLAGNIDLGNLESLMANIGPFYANVLLVSLFGIFVHSLFAGVFYSYVEAYVKSDKGSVELSDITPYLFHNGLVVLGAAVTFYVIFLMGFITFIFPGIYFAITFSPVIVIVIMERKGVGNALSRSFKLVHRNWGNTFLLVLIGIIIPFIAGFVVSIPAALFESTGSVQAATESIPDTPSSFWVLSVVTSVVSSLFWIVLYTFLAFQYFNLNEREKN